MMSPRSAAAVAVALLAASCTRDAPEPAGGGDPVDEGGTRTGGSGGSAGAKASGGADATGGTIGPGTGGVPAEPLECAPLDCGDGGCDTLKWPVYCDPTFPYYVSTVLGGCGYIGLVWDYKTPGVPDSTVWYDAATGARVGSVGPRGFDSAALSCTGDQPPADCRMTSCRPCAAPTVAGAACTRAELGLDGVPVR